MKKTASLIVILILILSAMPFASVKPVFATGESWLTGWANRKSHIINNASGAGTNYQVKINVINGTTADSGNTVYENNSANSNWSDIRFTASNGNTLLDAWNETQINGVNLTCWVEISDNLSAVNSTIYIYYGNPSASPYWNGDNTFLFFDDFPDSSLNTTKWTKTTSNVTVANSIVTVSQSNSSWSGILGSISTTYGRWRSLSRLPNTTLYEVFGFANEATITSATADLVVLYRNPGFYYAYVHKHPNLDTSFTFTGSTSMLTYEIDWVSGNASFYKSDDYLGSDITNVPTIALNAVITAATSTVVATVFSDWVFLSKYVSPEPVHSTWGVLEYEVSYILTLYFTSGVSVITMNGTSYGNGSSLSYRLQNMTIVLQLSGLSGYAFENWTYGANSNTSNPFYLLLDVNYTVWCYLATFTATPFIFARFTFNNSAPYQNYDPVLFNGSLSNSSEVIISYLWNFGDSNTSTGITTTHIYSTEGIFIVNLTVVSATMTDTMLQNITVLSTSINVSFDWNDLLFGSGAWIPLIIIVAVMFVMVTWNRYAVIASLPIMAIMSLLYFQNTTVAYPLIWHALIMITSAIILLLYSATKK
jgi:PKD repeat protein